MNDVTTFFQQMAQLLSHIAGTVHSCDPAVWFCFV